MSELQERCVLLKNLPHTCEERAVRDTLDFARGDFRYEGKYEKLHRHIEFGDDVRWIVLFYSKEDASECIKSGPWVSDAIRGGCKVLPDLCSGCIIPDEWSEETPGDGDWDMGDSFRTRDCNTDTSDEFMNSFVNVKSYKYQSDTDSGDDIHEQDVANANRETDGLDDALNLTVKYENKFETLIFDIDSTDQFDSGKSNEAADEVKDELNFENTSRNVSPIGEERIPTNELFGSGIVELKEKEKDEITINKSKENVEKTVTKGATGIAIDIDRGTSSPIGEERIPTNELFGSGGVELKEKEIDEIAINKSKENIDKTVTKGATGGTMDIDRGTRKPNRKSFDSDRDLNTKADKTSVILENTKTKSKSKSEHEGSEYYDDGKGSSVSPSELFERGDKVPKDNMHGPDDLLDKTKNNNAKKQAENRKEITFDKPHVSPTHSETKTDAEKSKKTMSASVRSVDLFGSGHESMEFHYMEKQDHFGEASREQGAVNKDTDNETDEAKSEALKEQPVTTNLETGGGVQAGSGINQGGPYPFQGGPYPYQAGQNPYQGVPYPYFGTMFPNSHGASNATYESNMTMMGQGQPQPNETSPGNPGSAWNMNQMHAMYQMYSQLPMSMPVQVPGQPIYPVPLPGMMPQMQKDEKGNPIQNYPGMPFYYIPYISGQPPFPTSGLQQSSDEKNQAIDEGHSAHAPLYTEPNNVETNMKTKEGSKPLKFDRSKSLNETEGYVYDVPYSNHRGLARQTSASDTLGNTEDIRPYSLAREIKSVYSEENIYDEIDEEKLKSLRYNSVSDSARSPAPPPAPPRTRPPSKPRRTDTKKSRLSVYDDNECEDNLEGNDNVQSGGAEESCRTILVTGLSSDVTEDALELYFENKKKTGGGEIVSAVMNEKKTEVIIEFKEQEDAKEVIKRAHNGERFTLYGCQLHVSEYRAPPVDPFKVYNNLEGNDNIQSGGAEESCRTILVTGLSLDVTKDALELYFENKKKTGGGEIVSAVMNEKKTEVIIEFKKHEDAKEVIKRAHNGERFNLCDCQLHVSEYHPPPLDSFKVYIKGIAATTTNECITNFIAALMHLEPLSIIHGETPGTALVTFGSPIDVAKLREVCERRKCEGKYWKIFDVEVVRSIKVEGLSDKTSTDTLSLYFENTRRSQGGEVESVQFRENHDDFIVTFKHSEDAERVCNTNHKVNGETISVSLFYSCLELDEDFLVKIPPPIQLDDQDDYIVKFIINSELYRARLESKIKENYGEIVWPPADNVGNIGVQINCNVHEKDTKGHAKVKNWTETCLSVVKEITNGLIVERSRNVAVEVWSELKRRLMEIEVPHPESIAVFLEGSNCVIVMVGEKQVVQTMAYNVQEIINEIEKKIHSENQTVTKRRKFRTFELALFRASRLEASLKKMLQEVEIDNEKKEISLKGSQKNVDNALERVDKTLKSFVKRPVPGISRQMINLLFKREARDLVKKKMIEKKVMGVWDVIKGTNLIMYSKNEKDLDVAIEILQSSIIMDTIMLDDEKSNILNSTVGKTKVAEFEENYQGCILFEIAPEELRFVCVSDIHQEIKDEFTKLFDLHSVISKFIPTKSGIFSYIITHNKRDIEGIERQYQRLSVAIEVKDSRRNPGFVVKGKKDGCKLAIDKLQHLIDSVVCKDHIISWPGFDTFILSSEGRRSIQSIEVNEKCVIKVSSEVLSSGLESTIHTAVASKEPKERASTAGKIIKAVKIGTLASEQVDVIVNSTNRNLDMNVGAISRTLLKAGGDIIEKECKKNYVDGIKPGEVAVTTAGALSCNELYHGLLVRWDGGQGLAEKVMVHFIKCCLTLASASKHTSIAFPALGTGAMGFPADTVAQIMFETVDAFEAKNPDTSLRTVRFVVWSEDKATARAFKDMEAKAGFQRSSESGIRRSYLQSEAANNLIVKNKGYSTTIGPVSLSIVKDDLTTFTSGAIVNSTMEDLNLNSGAISRAILGAAGSTIQNEALLRKQHFMRDGFVVTSPGRLLCSNIIHVKARNSLAGWAESIKKCLMETERLGLNSIAFPALGTGGKGISADRMAKTMIDVFQDYIKSSDFQKCLKTIRIVIFEERMLETFIFETKAELDTDKPAKWRSYLPDLKFWEKKTPEAENIPKVTVHIYCGSKYLIDLVVKKVEEIRQEKDVFVPRIFLEHMDDKLKSDLRRIGQSLGVKVVVDKSRVKVMGYGQSVANANKKLDEYINKSVDELRKGNAASSVKLPKIWSKMRLSDPTIIEVLRPSASDYIGVKNKFLNETGYFTTCIVKIERIQNPTLFMQYAGKKKQMEILNKGGRNVEQILWHGTKSTAVDNIKNKGFDRNYNSGSSHGVGVYFAVKASTSANGYCRADGMGLKHIFLAHVLTGEYCVGQGGIRVPPANPALTSGTYDSTTDNVQAPNFFVIFHDAQAYPSYLITFK